MTSFVLLRPRLAAMAVGAAIALVGCANMDDTGRRTTTGAGIGAASGAIIGSFGGNAGWGALAGAAVGGTGGYLYDRSKKNEEAAYRRGYVDAGRRR